MIATIRAFFDSQDALILYACLVLAAADFLLGVSAAFRDGVFRLDSVAAYLRKHIAGRVFPIAILIGLGYFGQQPALTAIGAASAAAYTLETIGSIRASWSGSRDVQRVPGD